MSVDALAALFFEAAETERRLPRAFDLRVRTSWPETVSEWSAYGYSEAEAPLGPATARSVQRYDLALRLTPLMDVDDARLVWATATTAAFRERGPNWRKVAARIRCHPSTAKRRFTQAILALYYRIATEATRTAADAREAILR
jgi:hypothetical protein